MQTGCTSSHFLRRIRQVQQPLEVLILTEWTGSVQDERWWEMELAGPEALLIRASEDQLTGNATRLRMQGLSRAGNTCRNPLIGDTIQAPVLVITSVVFRPGNQVTGQSVHHRGRKACSAPRPPR